MDKSKVARFLAHPVHLIQRDSRPSLLLTMFVTMMFLSDKQDTSCAITQSNCIFSYIGTTVSDITDAK